MLRSTRAARCTSPPPGALPFVRSQLPPLAEMRNKAAAAGYPLLQKQQSVAAGGGSGGSALSPEQELAHEQQERSIYNVRAGGVPISCSRCVTVEPTPIRPELRSPSPSALSAAQQQAEDAANSFLRNPTTLSPMARTAQGQSLFESARIPVDLFEGNAKMQWIDGDKGWCYLCGEPVGVGSGGGLAGEPGGSSSGGFHVGDRDHSNLGVFLHLFSLYPRHHPPRDIFFDALERHPNIMMHICGQPTSTDHLHTLDDVQRRLELEAMLLHLSEERGGDGGGEDSEHPAILYSLRGEAPITLWVSGERCWKRNITRLASTMAPPQSAGVMTAFTQKIWSRTNLATMYDLLRVADLNKRFGTEPKTERLPKAFFMRTLIWELLVAHDNVRDTNSFVTQVLIETFIRGLAFELFYLMSMGYMNRINDILFARQNSGNAGKLGFVPTYQDMAELDSL